MAENQERRCLKLADGSELAEVRVGVAESPEHSRRDRLVGSPGLSVAKLIVRRVIVATTTETISAIAAVVTVGLAVLTVWLTGKTVRESQKARKDNTDAHAKEIEESGKLLNAMVAARAATFHEGFESFERELAVQRIVGLGSMAILLCSCADQARVERGMTLAGLEWTSMTTLAMRLEVAVSLYRALGGEAHPNQPITADILEFAAHSRGKTEPRERILSDANDLLVRVNQLAKYEHETFLRLREHRVVREGLGQPDPTRADAVGLPR